MGENLHPEAEKESLIWGEGYPTVENYSADFTCKNQNCGRHEKRVVEEDDWYKMIVGMQKPPANMQKPNKPYAIVCECPECFEKFWFHADPLFAGTCKRIIEKFKSEQ